MELFPIVLLETKMKIEMTESKYDKLLEFNSKITINGTVSKGDVLSLEGFVGAPIITSAININRFTELDSAICLDKVREVVEEAIAGAKINDVVTYEVFMRKLISIQPEYNRLLDMMRDLSKISQDTLDRFQNEKHIYSYVNAANEETTSITIVSKDISVYEALCWRRDYVSAVLDTKTVGNRAFDYIYEAFEKHWEKYGSSVDYVALPLLNLMVDKGIDSITDNTLPTFRQITIEDMCKFISTIDLHIDKMLKLGSRIQSDIRMYKNDITYYNNSASDTTYFKTVYDKYDNMSKMLSDENSLLILRILGYFAYER